MKTLLLILAMFLVSHNVREIRFLYSEAQRRDAAIHREGCDRSAGSRHLRLPAIAAAAAGRGEYSAIEVAGEASVEIGRF